MPGASGLSKREVLEPLVAELRRLRPDADAPEYFDWRARTNEAMCKLFGRRHRLTVSLRDVTFTPDFAQGRARALALLRTAAGLDTTSQAPPIEVPPIEASPIEASPTEASAIEAAPIEVPPIADEDPGKLPATAHEEADVTSMPEPVTQPAPDVVAPGVYDSGALEETTPAAPADSPDTAGAEASAPSAAVAADIEAAQPPPETTGKHAPLVERALPDWPDWTDWPDGLSGEEQSDATSDAPSSGAHDETLRQAERAEEGEQVLAAEATAPCPADPTPVDAEPVRESIFRKIVRKRESAEVRSSALDEAADDVEPPGVEPPGAEPAPATVIDSVLPAWPDWVGWPEAATAQDKPAHTSEAHEEPAPDDGTWASADQASDQSDKEGLARETSQAVEETSLPVAVDTAGALLGDVTPAPIAESAVVDWPEWTRSPDVPENVTHLEAASGPGDGEAAVDTSGVNDAADSPSDPALASEAAPSETETETETESEQGGLFRRLMRRRPGLQASPAAAGEPAQPVNGVADELLHTEAGETSGDDVLGGESAGTAPPAAPAAPATPAPPAGTAPPATPAFESAVPPAEAADELMSCPAEGSIGLAAVTPPAAQEPLTASALAAPEPSSAAAQPATQESSLAQELPAAQEGPPTQASIAAPEPSATQEPIAAAEVPTPSAHSGKTTPATQEPPAGREPAAVQKPVRAKKHSGGEPPVTGTGPEATRSPRAVLGGGVSAVRKIAMADEPGASKGRAAFGARPGGAPTWDGIDPTGATSSLREATTKPFLTEPGTILREFRASEVGNRIGRPFDTSDLVPVAPHPANWGKQRGPNWGKQKGTSRPGRRLKRLLVAAVITVFLALALTLPVRASWIEGWSTILRLDSGEGTSATATLPALGPSANARVVDVLGDPRSSYILQVVRAGIIRFQPNETGEVSFLPTKLVARGEFLVWLDRVQPIPRGNAYLPAGLFYDLDPVLRELAGAAHQRRIILAWPRGDAQIAFKASDPILVRDAEAWAARMIVGLLPGTALQRGLGITETDALDLRARISSLSAQELAMVVEAFELPPEGGWAKKESLSRSEAAEFLMNLKAVFDEHLEL